MPPTPHRVLASILSSHEFPTSFPGIKYRGVGSSRPPRGIKTSSTPPRGLVGGCSLALSHFEARRSEYDAKGGGFTLRGTHMKHSCPVADGSRKPDGWWLVLNTPGTNVNSIHEAPRQTAGTTAGFSSGLEFLRCSDPDCRKQIFGQGLDRVRSARGGEKASSTPSRVVQW